MFKTNVHVPKKSVGVATARIVVKAALESPFRRGLLFPPSALLSATFYATYKKKQNKHNMRTVSLYWGAETKRQS